MCQSKSNLKHCWNKGVPATLAFSFSLLVFLSMASVTAAEDDEGVLRERRGISPAHYLFKIEGFSLFSKNGLDKISSKTFKAGEYKWKILLFPKGNNRGKGDYVSIYLMMEITTNIPVGKDINAFFKFFLFDQFRGEYLTVQGSARRFDWVKNEWGFDKFIRLIDFEQPTNGFLVNDTSFFGVEVFVTESSRLGECLSISEVPNISGFPNISGKYEWVINQFSKLGEECFSNVFIVGGHKWKLHLYPQGYSNYKGFSLSLFLVSVDSQSPMSDHKVKAEFTLTLKNKFSGNYAKNRTTIWFGAPTQRHGWRSFIKLKDLQDRAKGFLAKDSCVIEAEVTVVCETSQKMLNC
ncbi:MATH domain and coiled-coil domain-containing protein At3g58360-like [Daucus carota subsp. sativus]|nr:PREDICTED: MATH domain and coiled-coil domain-containing protein At3g58360-like [Daucus carota subsp. sativus]